MKRVLVVCITLCLALAGGLSLHISQRATAADLTLFRPGKIIDDVIFTDNNSMSATDIQNFFVQHNSVCLTNFTSLSLHDDNGDGVVQDTTTEPYGPGTMTAAQLIKAAADIYHINPKVLLVTLQKEQGLITTSDCAAWKYNTALGYGCPDTSPCDQSAYGFTRQIDYGTYHFRGYYDDSLASVPYGVGNYNIAYNPDSSCGSSTVNIENRATASLYSYTPYQPNQAALDAGYGTGNACSAYGNRNFFNYFTDWFGSTYAPNYSWRPASQYAFTDDTKTTPIGLNNLLPGQRVFVGLTAKNMGNITWTNGGTNPVRLGTLRGTDRTSAFYDPTWIGYGRPTVMKEAAVAPGEIATFEFWITAPESYQGNFNEYFGLLAEGKAWMPDIGLFYSIYVQPPRYTWSLTSQYAYTDETKSIATGLGGMQPGQRVYVGFTARNTGNITWKNTGLNPLRAGTTHSLDRASSFYDSTWINSSRAATMKEASVAPGEIGTFEFWMHAPMSLKGGSYNEYMNPLKEGKAWLADPGMNFAASTITPIYTWKPLSQYAYTDSSKTTAVGLESLAPNQIVYVGFTAVNTGNVTWHNNGQNPVRLGATHPLDGPSIACDQSSWISCTRPAIMKESSVIPGQTATFEFNLKAPANPGVYRAYFSPLSEGFSWMDDPGLNFYLVVK